MADPFSIVGLITGVVELADMVFVRTFLYVKAVKGGDTERSDLNSEVGALFGILSRLQLLSGAMEGEEEDGDCKPVLQAGHLNKCVKTLLTIKSRLDAHEGHGPVTGRHTLRSTLKSLRWPFTSSEVGDLLVEIERHKTNLSLALAADAFSGLLRALSTQGEICETIHGIEGELSRVALKDQRRQVLNSFGSTDPGKNHDMNRKLWHPCTGLWLTNGTEFQGWLTNKSARNIWCYGIPGSGKTVLASAAIEEVLKCRSHNVAAAYFYCDYKDVKTQDPANILGSLAKQLILQSERCFKESEAFYEVHHSGKQVSASYRPDELRDLILQMSSIFNQTMIVVDGLDECGKDTTTVVELLSSFSKSEISSVQSLFFSRDEIEIRESLTDYTPLSIAADKGDLQLYVAAELGNRMKSRRLHINNKSIREHIMDRLVNGANGMFRWAACQIDYLCELPDDRERCRALETLPPDLKSTYERILRRVAGTNIYVQRLVQRTLRWLVVAKCELTISALREALSMKEGISRLDRNAVPDDFVLLRSCSSLVRKSTSGQGLELAHFTVKEFLPGMDCDSEFSAYRVDVDESEVELGKVCLTYLTLQDFNSGGPWSQETLLKRHQEYAFRHYAVENWRSHADCRLGDPGLLTLIQKLLDPSKPGTFTTWTQDYQHIFGLPWPTTWRIPSSTEEVQMIDAAVAMDTPLHYEELAPMIGTAAATDTPLHYASALALPEICKWLLDCGCKVNHMSRFGTPLNHALSGPFSVIWSTDPFTGKSNYEMQNKNVCKVIDLLLEAGADPNSESLFRFSPLHYAWTDREIILRLLQKGARYKNESAYYLPSHTRKARDLLNTVGRENLHEDDYAWLLERAIHEDACGVD